MFYAEQWLTNCISIKVKKSMELIIIIYIYIYTSLNNKKMKNM